QGYGVLELLNAEPAAQLEEVDFYDWCQEIANVAMGRAASLLAGVIHEGVELSIPRVNLLERSELVMLLGGVGHHGVSIVSQGFIGAGLAGETLLFFDDSSVPALARLMNYDDSAPEESELELLMEVGNVLVGAFLKGISEQLDVKFSQGHPRLYLHSQAKELLQGGGAQRTLAIELSYDIGSVPVHCDQVLLFTETSINALQQHMEVVRL
ncbi:MAG: response regulator, partial [Pseudomonadota bacterium]